VFAKPDEIDQPAGAGLQPAGSGLSLLSRTGPEVPPDAAVAPPPCLVEPTEALPIIVVPPPPVAPRQPPAASVAARAVIVYETPARRPWRLWVFTAVIVALTIGVVLGQAVAWQPVSRSGSVAEAQVVTPPSGAAPTQLGLGSGAGRGAGPGQQVSAPLGSTRTRVLEVTGAATLLRIRSADLGATLFHAAALDSSVVPSWTDTGKGTRLELVRTGTPGTAGLDIQLTTRVAWTIHLTGPATEQDVDMRAGGLAGLMITGGSSSIALRLPKPRGGVPLAFAGGISRISVAATTGIPVRLRLTKGASLVTVDEAKQRTVHTPPGWKTAKNRYDLTTYGPVGSVAVTHH
jgi:hypothetical protein